MAYPNPKIYHYASKISEKGDVSALCYAKPKPINLAIACWTIRRAAVTCRKCRRILAGMAYPEKQEP